MRQLRPGRRSRPGAPGRLWPSAALLLCAVAAPASAKVESEARTLPGLAAPGEIVIDNWGIPHIYAASPRDAFFLQGYAVARERLWQIDLWRKRGLGRLAASFGPDYVAQDRAARLFLYRGDMAAEWAAYPKEAKGWAEAFAAGINVYIADTEAGRQPLPPEFAATDSKPERWAADDIVRIRTNALVANLAAEVARARSLCLGGLPWEPLRRKLEPEHQIEVPKGFDPCVITSDLLTDYRLATAGVRFDKGKVIAVRDDGEAREGSNNWAVAPARSATGRAILAGDPHRDHSVPSLRWISHLEAPGLRIAGAGEPSQPGIAYGHNDDIAWALTIFAMDQQDLLVSPIAEAVSSVTETIEVKGAKWQQVRLSFTPEGPVIAEAGRWRFALRATWALPGASAYADAAWLFRGKDWQDFLRARDHWGAPPLNLVYADTKGNIGWAAAGFFPDRKGYDGLTPVLADRAWTGLNRPDVLPVIKNPAKGWLGSANQFNLRPGNIPTSYEWANPSRMARITRVLDAKPRISLADSMALQNDDHSEQALKAVALLKPLPGPAAALLKGWDGNLGKDSAAAALFEIWTARHLGPAAVAAIVPAEARPAFANPEIFAVVDWLTTHPEGRDAILAASLDAAWADAVARMGPDPATWRWGTIHQAKFVPTVTLPGRQAEQIVGPVPLGGGAYSPKAATHEGAATGDFTLTAGASVRMVLDVGQWDDSVIINTPGQSGSVDSPHYKDLFPLWAEGRYVPFLWSRDKVMAAAERVIRAAPAN